MFGDIQLSFVLPAKQIDRLEEKYASLVFAIGSSLALIAALC